MDSVRVVHIATKNKNIMKKIFVYLSFATLMVMGSMVLKSCESEERIVLYNNDRIERIANCSDFRQYIALLAAQEQQFSDALNAMNVKEREFLLRNYRSKEVAMRFLEKNNLMEAPALMAEKRLRILNNEDYRKLSSNERTILYKMIRVWDVRSVPRLRSGAVELGKEDCLSRWRDASYALNRRVAAEFDLCREGGRTLHECWMARQIAIYEGRDALQERLENCLETGVW